MNGLRQMANAVEGRKTGNAVRLLVCVTACCFCLGCGSGLPETAPVTGKVTINGQAVQSGKITFYPAEGRPAMGEIGSDGTFRLTTFADGDGAVLGKHKVTIKATQVTGTPPPRSFEEELARAKEKTPMTASVVEWIVPEKYARQESTPLEREVKRGENLINFVLPE